MTHFAIEGVVPKNFLPDLFHPVTTKLQGRNCFGILQCGDVATRLHPANRTPDKFASQFLAITKPYFEWSLKQFRESFNDFLPRTFDGEKFQGVFFTGKAQLLTLRLVGKKLF